MSGLDWRSVMGARDRAVYEAAGYGRPASPGERPVLLIIDVTYAFIGREPLPILESIERYPNSCGASGWAAASAIARMLPPMRSLGRPVVYSTGFSQLSVRGSGLWSEKHPDASRTPDDGDTIPAHISPVGDDVVLPKT